MDPRSDARRWLPYGLAGWLFLLPILVLMGGGWLLDRLTGLSPGFTVLGAIVGFLAGLWLLLRVQRRLVEARRRMDRERAGSGDAEAGEEDRVEP